MDEFEEERLAESDRHRGFFTLHDTYVRQPNVAAWGA